MSSGDNRRFRSLAAWIITLGAFGLLVWLVVRGGVLSLSQGFVLWIGGALAVILMVLLLQALLKRDEHRHQKHFMENASHELQTPLAVIRSNLELILQSERLDKLDVQRLSAAMDAADKLSRINKALILLSRIEHEQFGQRSFVSINDMVEEILALFAMEIEAKDLTLHIEHIAPCTIQMNEVLAEVVLKNLIQNSIRHNLSGGKVSVWIGKNFLKIQNSGPMLKVSPSKLFERFYRDSESEASIGLGLAIVRQICDSYGFPINYSSEGKQHILTLNFEIPT